jgi:hypothetical protein
MVKILPNLPFAPGYKLVVLTPLYILAAQLTRTRFGATITGLTMGTVAFLMGDGRYAIFEILKHVAPGILCDLFMPLWMQRRDGSARGPVAWAVFGGFVSAGRFATILAVALAVQPPAAVFVMLVPNLLVQVFFGSLSGWVSFHLVRATAELRARLRAEPEPARDEAPPGGDQPDRGRRHDDDQRADSPRSEALP